MHPDVRQATVMEGQVAPEPAGSARSSLRPTAYLDVVFAAGLAIAAAIAALSLPAGSSLRFVLALPILLFAPGYLLLQAAMVPARPARSRLVHGLLSTGLSPALVGLVALVTAIVPGGFRPIPIVLVVTMFCLACAAVAVVRRWVYPELPRARHTAPALAKPPA